MVCYLFSYLFFMAFGIRSISSYTDCFKLLGFVLKTALGKILTLEDLRKRHVMCSMYKKNKESVDHHPLYCKVVSTLWQAMFIL